MSKSLIFLISHDSHGVCETLSQPMFLELSVNVELSLPRTFPVTQSQLPDLLEDTDGSNHVPRTAPQEAQESSGSVRSLIPNISFNKHPSRRVHCNTFLGLLPRDYRFAFGMSSQVGQY